MDERPSMNAIGLRTAALGLALAASAMLLPNLANAQTAAMGRDLWWNPALVKARAMLPSCASCHTAASGLPTKAPPARVPGASEADINASLVVNLGGMRDIYGLTGTILTAVDQSSLELYLANPGAVPSARTLVNPGVLSFPNTAVGVDSAAMTFTLAHNTGSAAPFTLAAANAITVSGTNAADFRVSGGTCVNGLAVTTMNTCTIQVTFRPTAVGNGRAATVSVAFAETHVPAVSMPVVGNGAAAPQPSISLSATTLAFSGIVVAATSAAQTVTLTNGGTAQLDITSLTTGGTNGTEFTRGGTCPAAGAVAAGANCTITYTFTPGALGARTGSLTIASNNPGGNVTVGLTGTGISNTPVLFSTPAALTFNTTVGQVSAAQSITIRNDGGGSLAVTSATSSSNLFSATAGAACAALAFGQTCTIGVTFSPIALGQATGTLTIANNAGASAVINLTGTGQSATPVVAMSPASVTFANVTAVGQQSAPQRVRFTNNGPGAVTLASVASSAEFPTTTTAIAAPCTASLSIAVGAFCEIDVRFAPSAGGARTGALSFASNGTPANASVPLNGTGTATAAATLGYSVPGTPQGQDQGPLFPITMAGASSQPIVVTIVKRGTLAMTFAATPAAISSASMNPGDFRVGTATCAAATPLQPNTGNCTVQVIFAPTAAGASTRNAILQVSFNGTSSQVPLYGVVEGASGGTPAAPPSSSASPAPAAVSSKDGGGGAIDWTVGLLLLMLATALRRRSACQLDDRSR